MARFEGFDNSPNPADQAANLSAAEQAAQNFGSFLRGEQSLGGHTHPLVELLRGNIPGLKMPEGDSDPAMRLFNQSAQVGGVIPGGEGGRVNPEMMNSWIEGELKGSRPLEFSRSRAGEPTPTWGGKLAYHHRDAPLTLTLADKADNYPNHWVAKFLDLNGQIEPTPEMDARYRGQGMSTDLYLAALKDAQSAGKGFVSDTIRTDNTERMYERLAKMGVPVRFESELPGAGEVMHGRNAHSGGRYVIPPEELAKTPITELPGVVAVPALRRLMQPGAQSQDR